MTNINHNNTNGANQMGRKFGIELEGIGMSRAEVANLLNTNGVECSNAGYTHQVMRKWKVVSDSSVYGGFELVSPPLQGEAGVEEVRKVVRLVNNAGGGVNRNCGIHVHVEMSNATPQHIANVYNRYKTYEMDIDKLMPESRRANNNCMCRSMVRQPQLNPAQTARATTAQRRDRYYKLNLACFVKYGTIEFRQHSGSFNSSKVCNWINFLLEFVEASKELQGQVRNNPAISGKSEAIVDYIQADRPTSASQIAQAIGSTTDSVYSMITGLRNKGYTITKNQQGYRVTPPAMFTPRYADNLWTGITTSIKEYYARRASVLAAA